MAALVTAPTASSTKAEEERLPLGIHLWTPYLLLLGSFAVLVNLYTSVGCCLYSPPESPPLASIMMTAGLTLVFLGLWIVGDRAGLWRPRPRGRGEWGAIALTFGFFLVLYGLYLGRWISVPSLEFLFVETAGWVAVSGLAVLRDWEVIRRLPSPRWLLGAWWASLGAYLFALVLSYETAWIIAKLPWRIAGDLEAVWLGPVVILLAMTGFGMSVSSVCLFPQIVRQGRPKPAS